MNSSHQLINKQFLTLSSDLNNYQVNWMQSTSVRICGNTIFFCLFCSVLWHNTCYAWMKNRTTWFLQILSLFLLVLWLSLVCAKLSCPKQRTSPFFILITEIGGEILIFLFHWATEHHNGNGHLIHTKQFSFTISISL
jgi:hypothetical protein